MARRTETLSLYNFSAVDVNYPNQVLGFNNPEKLVRELKSQEDVATREVYARISQPSFGGRNRLYSAEAKVCMSADYYSSGEKVFVVPANKSYSASTITWTNKPNQLGIYELHSTSYVYYGDPEDVSCVIYLDYPTEAQQSELAHNFLAYRTCFFYPSLTASSSSYLARKINFYNKLTNGTTAPYITITYDDSVTVSSKIEAVSYPSGDSVNNAKQLAFSWQYVRNGTYHCMNEAWTQQSAILYWRVSGASTWNQIAISGAATSKTLPAYTFPGGSVIQWYLKGTDTEGTTSQTTTYSFTTLPFTVTPTNYPTGNNIDTRASQKFEYTVENAEGAVLQNGSTFYWRVAGASTWNSIPATHTGKARTIAANTFPTASTIQWKIQVTDRSGLGTAESNVFSFTTVTTQITATIYPSGNNIPPGNVLPFQWVYNSAVGEYNQSSAVFYWRKATTDPYTSISISGATKSLNVPKNTFPTNATIYWYLKGTDIGGHESQTQVQNFKTATSQITPQSSPTSGYKDPRYAIEFSWYFDAAGSAIPQGSASLFWKVSTASTYTEVQASGTTTSVTIPANTFPVAALIDWYISGTDKWGVSSTSEIYQFSTAAATIYASCVSPVGSAEDTTKPITMQWTLSSSDGASPTRVTAAWKRPTESASEWHQLVDSSDPITSLTVPGYTFPAGEIQWKVQATNRDGVAGPESLAAFVSLRAPDPPTGLSATSVPISTISWQSDEQQAYEISIDGKVVQKAFGIGVYEWTVPEPLEDSVHEISVRVQSSFGLWSNPAETSVDIQNTVPTGWDDLALTGAFGVDAILEATGAEAAEGIATQWYRDGKRIGETEARIFTDRRSLGAHSWYAEIWSQDGNYARSNTVEGFLESRVTRIAPLDSGDWLELRLSENSEGLQGFSYQRTQSLRHVLGTNWPVLERSGFEDLSGSYSCAFRTYAEAEAFERLRGQVVILKSRGGRMVVGALSELSCSVTDFYTAYSFGISQIDWEDFVHDA